MRAQRAPICPRATLFERKHIPLRRIRTGKHLGPDSSAIWLLPRSGGHRITPAPRADLDMTLNGAERRTNGHGKAIRELVMAA